MGSDDASYSTGFDIEVSGGRSETTPTDGPCRAVGDPLTAAWQNVVVVARR